MFTVRHWSTLWWRHLAFFTGTLSQWSGNYTTGCRGPQAGCCGLMFMWGGWPRRPIRCFCFLCSVIYTGNKVNWLKSISTIFKHLHLIILKFRRTVYNSSANKEWRNGNLFLRKSPEKSMSDSQHVLKLQILLETLFYVSHWPRIWKHILLVPELADKRTAGPCASTRLSQKSEQEVKDGKQGSYLVVVVPVIV